METTFIYELIGYIASLLVAISLMMSAIVKLRVVNMIGAFTFAIYGVLIGSIPVAGMNAFIVLINIYYLVKIWRDQSYFDLLHSSHNSPYLNKFLEFYRNHIETYQPDFDFSATYDYVLFVLSDMVPAGLLLGHQVENRLHIDLDFVIPTYRDFKIGEYLFKKNASHFAEQGIDELTTSPGNDEHNHYLQKMGFNREGSLYRLKLSKGDTL